MLYLIGYIATIFAANWALQTFGVIPILVTDELQVAAPAGVFFAGLAFTLRDLTQDTLGKWAVLAAIVVGAACSAFVSLTLALASGGAFLVSELADFAVYTPLRERGWIRAVVASNAVGLVLDSALFLWLAFGSLDFMACQIVGNAWMTLLAVVALDIVQRNREAKREAASGRVSGW